MKASHCLTIVTLMAGLGVGRSAAAADREKKLSMHDIARGSSLPRAHKDFSAFRYRPPGDKVIEQADASRLLFRTPTGQPDGYAERRGDSIVYFDRRGKAIRVQPAPVEASDTAIR